MADITPAAGTLSLDGIAPPLGGALFPAAGTLTLDGIAPPLARSELFPAAGTFAGTGFAPSASVDFRVSPSSGLCILTPQAVGTPPWLVHVRTVTRPRQFALGHTRQIVSDTQPIALMHSRTILRIAGARLEHSRVILPAAVFTLFADGQQPTALVDKT